MIAPTKQLKQLAEAYPNSRKLSEQVGVDETVMSRLLDGKRGASATMMEKVCRFLGWKLDEAWEIVEGDGEAD